MSDLSAKGENRWVHIFIQAVNLIPLTVRIRLFENLGLVAYFLDSRHRRITRRNLLIAFPDKDPRDLSRMVRQVFRNLGRVMAEFTFTPYLNEGNIDRYITIEGLENFHRAQARGKGLLMLTAHFGNWEWMAAAFPLQGGAPGHAIVRPMDNSFQDLLVEQLRTSTGNKTISKQKAMGRILRLLKEGAVIGILLDQNMDWREGVFVPFFGELACTNVGLALLATKTGAAVLPTFNLRQPDGRYHTRIEPEVELFQSGDKEADVQKNTELFTRIIEDHVRAHPDHWLWLHQRWKTRPWQAKR